MSVNETHISTFCTQSLTRLCTEYALAEENATIECINSLINGEQMSRTDALALFFLLLNIDTQLKECMMVSEAEAQRGKLTNFCMNLRKHLVPEFMAVDQCNSSTFVTRCSLFRKSAKLLQSKCKDCSTTENKRYKLFDVACHCEECK